MKYKFVLIVLLGLFAPLYTFTLDLHVAPIYQFSGFDDITVYDDSPVTKDLINSINKADLRSVLSIKKTDCTTVPKSVLEIKTLCSDEEIDYILYGFLEVTDYSYDLEVKLYDHKAGKIQKIFYSKNSIDNYDELIETLAVRVNKYLYKELGLEGEVEDTESGFISFDSGIGYWFPLEPYGESLIGLISVHGAFNFYPKEPLFRAGMFGISLGFGFSLDYLLGMNRSGYESFVLHSPKIGLPLYASALWGGRNKLTFNLSPGLLVDIVQQERLYGGTHVESASAFVLTSGLGYEYLIKDKNYSVGLAVNGSVAFYRDLDVSINPLFVFKFY